MPPDHRYARTAKGTLEIRNRASALSPELQPVLMSIDGRATVAEISTRLRMADGALQQAMQQLHKAGYIEPAEAANDGDLDFTSPGAMSRLQAQAEARARAEAAAQARAEQARRDAAAAQEREQAHARAQAEAEAEAARAAQARAQADTAARAADAERALAAQQASAAQNEQSRRAAHARMEAAVLAETRAATQARELASAESAARAAAAHTQHTAARAREEAQAHARAESEAQARAHAEAHARAMVDAQLKAMSAALARAQALAREEADARARLTADLQAREAAEAQARADAAARARADAEAQMRAELARLQQEAQSAVEEAAARAEAEKLARETAEALVERERSARAAAEARAAADLEAQRRAHAAARAATQARVDEERAAREAAESRAQAEVRARLAHEAAVNADAEDKVRERVAQEISAREEAQRAADAQYRADVARRAETAAAARVPPAPRFVLKRGPRDRAALVKIGAVAAVSMVVGTALLLPMVPLDAYVPRLEQMASAMLRQPVRLGQMQYRIFPTPQLKIERIAIGASYGTRIEQVVVSAWPWEFFAESPRFDSMTVSGAVVEQDGISAIRSLIHPGKSGTQLQRVIFEGSRFTLQDIDLPVSSGTIRFDRNGGVRNVKIDSAGATLELVSAGGGTWNVALHGRTWKPPLGPALSFDSISLKGVTDGSTMKDATVNASIAGGEVTATVAADWRDRVRVEGRFEVTKAQLQSLMPAYTSHFNARGTLSAQGRYRIESATIGKLSEYPRVTADFLVASGELANVDLVRALQQVSAQGIQGGRTRFDQLLGSVEVTGDRYRYRELKLVSGPMTASGNVDIAPGNHLAGRVVAEVQTASRTAIRGSLRVGGTLTNPVLKP